MADETKTQSSVTRIVLDPRDVARLAGNLPIAGNPNHYPPGSVLALTAAGRRALDADHTEKD